MIFVTVAESSQIERGLEANFTSYLLTKYGENPWLKHPVQLINSYIFDLII